MYTYGHYHITVNSSISAFLAVAFLAVGFATNILIDLCDIFEEVRTIFIHFYVYTEETMNLSI